MRWRLRYSFIFLQTLLANLMIGILRATNHASTRSTSIKEVNVGVLLPVLELQDQVFDQPIRAVQMAFDEINKKPNELGILPNTRVNVVVNTTGYHRWQAIEAALWQVNVAKVVAIIGGADASQVKVISPVAKEASVPLVSPSAVEYELDSETLYPTFLRVGAPDSRLGLVVKEVLDQFSWTRVAVIHSDDDYGINGVRYAVDTARILGYDVKTVYLQEPHGPQLTSSEVSDIISLKENDYRIFLVVLHVGEEAAVLRVAAEQGMFAAGYAWVLAYCNYGSDLLPQSGMDGIICIRQQMNETAAEILWETMQSSQYRGRETSMWLDSIHAYNAANAIAQALHIVFQSNDSDSDDRLDEDVRGGDNPVYRPSPSPVGSQLLSVLKTQKIFSDQTGTFHVDIRAIAVDYAYLIYYNKTFLQFAEYKNNLFSLSSKSYKQIVRFPGDQTIVPLDKPSERHNMLNVLVPISYPFTDYIDKTTHESCVGRNDHSNCEFIGVAIELILSVTNRMGLSVNFTLWTDSWNDLVKEVGRKASEYDIAAGSVTLTSLRAQHARFSSSIYDSGLRILILRPEVEEQGFFEFFKPFSWSVWLLIIITLLSTSGVMLYLDPKAVNTRQEQEHSHDEEEYPLLLSGGKWSDRFHLYADAVYFSACTFFAVHRVDNINKLFSRVYIVVLCFWVLIMVSAYTANMAVFLTHKHATQDIRNYKDLANVPVGCRSGTSNWDYVNNELSLKMVVDVKDGHHAVKLLKLGQIKAYIADTPHVLGLASTDCSLVVVGPQEQHQKYAFPMNPSMAYHSQINKAILETVEQEFVMKTFNRILNNSCPQEQQEDDIRPITLDDIGGLFMLAGAMGVTIVFLKVSLLVWRRCLKSMRERNKRKRKQNSVVLDSGISGTYSGIHYAKVEDDSD
ncbi:uncharacterized protein LOC134193623 [Corticium candelabrum]|uniref:uncharacterized protein LOC134193623 n=1 Tax=Corticium candelabrum TaxID=121492 RepID=UPI002E276334|nr:uncharacterized protein LOC134193623 [Corticium candelabrum]